jgi:hypothetical protein
VRKCALATREVAEWRRRLSALLDLRGTGDRELCQAAGGAGSLKQVEARVGLAGVDAVAS